jgi:RHS repeat-associated protein
LGIDEPLALYRSGKKYYYHADGLGSVVALSDNHGTTKASYTYDAFGNNTPPSPPPPPSSVTNPFRYTGRELDSETGLYYYRARYYDPSTGRFLSEDPSQFARGVALYTYVFNDPANEIDPSGLAECFYRISSHTLRCVSRANIKAPPIVVGPENVSSGVGPCKDEPACVSIRDTGPIVPGEYRMNRDFRPGHEGIYRLEPVPQIPGWKVRLGLKRGGFELHPGTRTLGCINVLRTDERAMKQYRELLKLLQAEDSQNYLLVAP